MKELLFSVTRDDCDWSFMPAGGPGGQHSNKCSTACRCTHRASGAVGFAREYRSQKQNRAAAFKLMAESKEFKTWHRIEVARRLGQSLFDHKKGRSSDVVANARTYSFPDHRVTDHRTKLTVHEIDRVMNGHIDEFIQASIEKDSGV